MTDSTLEPLPPGVQELAPSARFVYRELARADGTLTVTELASRTGYSPRGIRHATNALEEEGYLHSTWRDRDPRERVFELLTDPD